jgi:hypothetical protein
MTLLPEPVRQSPTCEPGVRGAITSRLAGTPGIGEFDDRNETGSRSADGSIHDLPTKSGAPTRHAEVDS